jgi:hypothetical protein
LQDPFWKYPSQKVLAEWFKVKALSPRPSTAKKRKKERKKFLLEDFRLVSKVITSSAM